MRKLVALASVLVLAGPLEASALPVGSAPSFAAATGYATGSHPGSVAIGDLNGDRKPDLVTSNYDEVHGTVSVLVNRGDGSFKANVDYATGRDPHTVAIGDLNGDGKPDLAITNYRAHTVSVFVNTGEGGFQAQLDYRTRSKPTVVAIGDLNGDGKADLVTASGVASTVSVSLNKGDGSFQAEVDHRTGGGPVSIAIGDLNDDGNPDLATANDSAATVSVLLNKGNGRFRARRDYRAGRRSAEPAPLSVAVGDLNGDGKPDLATANYGDANTVSVLANKGDGSFRARREYRTGRWPTSVAVGDLNGDGKLDLATANQVSGTVSVLANRGGGSFQAKLDYAYGRGPGSVAIGDLERRPSAGPGDRERRREHRLCTPQQAGPLYGAERQEKDAPGREADNCAGQLPGQDYRPRLFGSGQKWPCTFAEAHARHGAAQWWQGQPRHQPWKEALVRIALVFAGLVALGGSLGIALAARNSDGVVSLGAPPTVAGSKITSTLPSQPSFEVWFARGDHLVPVARVHEQTREVATAAINALVAGPTRAERTSGVTTAVPSGTRLLGISIAKGVATVDLTSEYQSGGGSLSMQMRLGQVVYTLTQFPTVKTVLFQLDDAPVNVFSGEGIILENPVGRSDYKDLAPSARAVTGTWRGLPQAPIPAPDVRLSVWTGKEAIVFGRVDEHGPAGEILSSTDVAAAYDPAANTWRELAAPFSVPGYPGRWAAVWTGKEMLVWGDVNQAFDPATNRWRRLPPAPGGRGGIVVWTGQRADRVGRRLLRGRQLRRRGLQPVHRLLAEDRAPTRRRPAIAGRRVDRQGARDLPRAGP